MEIRQTHHYRERVNQRAVLTEKVEEEFKIAIKLLKKKKLQARR